MPILRLPASTIGNSWSMTLEERQVLITLLINGQNGASPKAAHYN